MKIGILVCTNRTNSFTQKIAEYYQNELKKINQPSTIIELASLPEDFAFSALYQNSGKNAEFNKFQAEIDTCDKLIFVIPEYNGSYPGVLKTFIDGLRHPDSLSHKKACLVGISSGVLGNAVGLGHFSDVLSYLNVNILGLRMKLGQIEKNFIDGEFTSPIFKSFIDKQITHFIEF